MMAAVPWVSSPRSARSTATEQRTVGISSIIGTIIVTRAVWVWARATSTATVVVIIAIMKVLKVAAGRSMQKEEEEGEEER